MEKKTGQKNVRQKNKDWVLKYYIFLSHIFLSDLLLGSLFPSFPYSLLISDSFKVPLAFPIGHRRIERCLFCAEEVRVMLDQIFAEGAPGKFARGESVRGFGKRVGHARQ